MEVRAKNKLATGAPKDLRKCSESCVNTSKQRNPRESIFSSKPKNYNTVQIQSISKNNANSREISTKIVKQGNTTVSSMAVKQTRTTKMSITGIRKSINRSEEINNNNEFTSKNVSVSETVRKTKVAVLNGIPQAGLNLSHTIENGRSQGRKFKLQLNNKRENNSGLKNKVNNVANANNNKCTGVNITTEGKKDASRCFNGKQSVTKQKVQVVEVTKSGVLINKMGGGCSRPKLMMGMCARRNNKVDVLEDYVEFRVEKKLEFSQPLASHVDLYEGSPLTLTVGVRGDLHHIVWTRNKKVIPNAPPDIEYGSDHLNGIYSLRIRDAFQEDSGTYVCEVYGANLRNKIESSCQVTISEIDSKLEDSQSEISTTDLNLPSGETLNSPEVDLIVPQIITPDDVQTSCEKLNTSLNKLNIMTSIDQQAERNSSRVSTLEEQVEEDECPQEVELYEPPRTECIELNSPLEQGTSICSPLITTGSQVPPKVILGPSNMMALNGESIHLRVKIQTSHNAPKKDVTCRVIWSKFLNGAYKPIDEINVQNRLKITTTSNSELTSLTITDVNYDDSGKYRVAVENEHGADFHHILLSVEGPPEPPALPPKIKYNQNSNTILVSWSSCPYDGGCAITGYYVESTVANENSTENEWTLLTPQSFKWLCYIVENPVLGSTYKFRIGAENIHGKGKPTEPSLALTVPQNGQRISSGDSQAVSLKKSPPFQQEIENLVSEHLGNVRIMDDKNLEEIQVEKRSFTELYEKHEELGKGRFGVVYRVTHKPSGESFAGKFVKCIKAKDKERVYLEVKIMNELRNHPKLICLFDAMEMTKEIVLITDHIKGGELFELVVADDFTLTEHDCVIFLQQICSAVQFMHGKRIMHLDLKPENILCTAKGSKEIKLIDFGLAQYFNPDEPTRVLFGTAEFVAPEVINYETVEPSADMWSIGVITYILLSGLSPFLGDSDNETFSNITIGEFDFDDESFDHVSNDAKDFISKLILKRKTKRMTAEECLQHVWLKQCDDENRRGIILSTDKLKRFLVRRKWQKTGNAIRALGRMTTLSSSRRSSSTSSTGTPANSPFNLRSMSIQEDCTKDFDSSVFTSEITNMDNTDDDTKHERMKYRENNRSDSGICDVLDH